jgi:hypothetical protein
MPDPLADSAERLQRLLEQATKEQDPEKGDALSTEIWQILRERERLSKASHRRPKKLRGGPPGVLD